jgi:uncharacterized protein (TIGR02001 family)
VGTDALTLASLICSLIPRGSGGPWRESFGPFPFRGEIILRGNLTNQRGYRMLLPVLAAAALFSWTGSALAIDENIIEPTPAAPAAVEPMQFDLSFGMAVTTDYVSRGITNTDSKPALQGYVEPSLGLFYVNVWASNVDYGEDFEGTEIDVAVGARPEIGPLSLDMGYVHYFYKPEDVSPDYGELFLKADYNVEDKFTLGGRIYFAPDYSQTGKTATFIAGGVRVPLPHDFSAYAGIGYQFFEDPDAFEQLAWTAGLSYSYKVLTFDVRYWDTDLSDDECEVRSGFADGCDTRVVGTVSVDLSLSELRD